MKKIIRKLLLTVAYLASLYCYTALSSSDSGNYSDLQAESGVTSLFSVGLMLKYIAPDLTPEHMDHASKFN
jgi:hypothetical protein